MAAGGACASRWKARSWPWPKGRGEFPLGEHLAIPTASPSSASSPTSCIGGVAEAAACAEKFARAGVGVSLTVTPCWCYGSETMDMDPLMPKAVWGFNGTERPGAVYLAAVLAGHNQKGLPAFGIYGRDVQDAGDTTIPADVGEKLLRFARAGLAAATMRGKSYLSLGGVSMGIAGSIVDQPFFEHYLGMRVECVDMTEVTRRIEEEIYDKDEFERALAWVQAELQGRQGLQPPKPAGGLPAQKEKDWQTVVKMTLIARDLMIGNPRLAELGFGEEALGHNAIAGGFQGQRAWTDHSPNGDFMEAILNSSFDWNGIRKPYMRRHRERQPQRRRHAVRLPAHQHRPDLRRRAHLLEPRGRQARHRRTTSQAAAAGGMIHLINSGAATLDGTGEQTSDGKPAMKPFWEITEAEAQKCLEATSWPHGHPRVLPRRRLLVVLPLAGRHAHDHDPPQPGQGARARAADRRRLVGRPPREGPRRPQRAHQPHLADHLVRPNVTGKGPFADVYSVMNHWSANHGAISYGHIGADLIALASLLRIPVAMHNVPEDKVFRPSTWGLFGAIDRKPPTTAPAPTSVRFTAELEPPRRSTMSCSRDSTATCDQNDSPRRQLMRNVSTNHGLTLSLARGVVLALRGSNPRRRAPARGRDPRPARRPDGLVARRPVWHVHPLGSLFRPRGRVQGPDSIIAEWFLETTHMPVSEYEKFAAAVQPREVRRQGVGGRRQEGGDEVHRHHLEAPRRLRHLSLGADRLVHQVHPLRPRPAQGTGGRLQGRGASASAPITRSWTGIIPTGASAGPGTTGPPAPPTWTGSTNT